MHAIIFLILLYIDKHTYTLTPDTHTHTHTQAIKTDPVLNWPTSTFDHSMH